VGLVAIHYAVFVPNEGAGERFLDWVGGYFDYQSGTAANHWFSKIQTATARVEPAAPEHPISRGLRPFDLREEYYYNIRFRDHDSRVTPILKAPILGEPEAQTVAWATQREDGGRGFGYTGGHFHANWAVPGVRKMILNAILWTARVDVPPDGASTSIPAALVAAPRVTLPADARPDSIRVIVVTGPQHPAHEWRSTTQALVEVLSADPRCRVQTVEFLEALGSVKPGDCDVIVLNTNDHERPQALDESGRDAFRSLVESGTGLVLVHFGNGGFRDWPAFRTLARRVWVDGMSGHDPNGAFRVEPVGEAHEIVQGLHSYDTTDELYFNQAGDGPAQVLVRARSKVTGKDEPLAFVYEVGKGRVFQSLLGHDAAAIRAGGTAELLRRGTAWAARRAVVPADRPK
jgi:type 1 glutamine amidotransferase